MHILIFGIGWLTSAAFAWMGCMGVIALVMTSDPTEIVARGTLLATGAFLTAAVATNPHVYSGRPTRAVAWNVAAGMLVAIMFFAGSFLVLTGTWR